MMNVFYGFAMGFLLHSSFWPGIPSLDRAVAAVAVLAAITDFFLVWRSRHTGS
jgi:hypothetical protein